MDMNSKLFGASGKSVLIVFGDRSLGGTSRSAYVAGKAWRRIGYKVLFHPFLPIHAGRLTAFTNVGDLIDDLAEVNWEIVEAVHYHHGAWSPRQLQAAETLLNSVAGLSKAPLLITNNIFAVRDQFLDAWPAERATCVLGSWAAEQYRANSGLRYRRDPFVVPNSQDDGFFRPPTEDERRDARAELGLGDEPCLLRLGSPHQGKWSRAYLALASAASEVNVRLVLVGLPSQLRADLESNDSAMCLDPIESDELLRKWYWAADAFVLDAERGESFGNVLFESMLCGTPVVYRAHIFRDNTPWELRGAKGFAYSVSASNWVQSSLRAVSDLTGEAGSLTDIDTIRGRYGIESVAAQLSRIIELAQQTSSNLATAAPVRLRPSVAERAAILVRHNPAVSFLKELALQRTK